MVPPTDTHTVILRAITVRLSIVEDIRRSASAHDGKTIIQPIGRAVDTIELSIREMEKTSEMPTLVIAFQAELALWVRLKTYFTARKKLQTNLKDDAIKYESAKYLEFSSDTQRHLAQAIEELKESIEAMNTLIDEQLDDIARQLRDEQRYVNKNVAQQVSSA
jgi:hypothetical protein